MNLMQPGEVWEADGMVWFCQSACKANVSASGMFMYPANGQLRESYSAEAFSQTFVSARRVYVPEANGFTSANEVREKWLNKNSR